MSIGEVCFILLPLEIPFLGACIVGIIGEWRKADK